MSDTLSLVEKVQVNINTAFMGMAGKAVERHWQGAGNVTTVVERMIATNYELHGVDRRHRLPPHWKEVPEQYTFLHYVNRPEPATHPTFDRITLPYCRMRVEVECALLDANRRLAEQLRFEVEDKAPVLWVPTDERLFTETFAILRKLDEERNLIADAAYKVVERCVLRPGLNTPTLAMASACECLPILRYVTPPERETSYQMRLSHGEMQAMLDGIDTRALLPALVRLEHHFAPITV